MSDRVTLTRECEIGILTIDNPPVNAFRPEMLAEVVSCVRAAEEAAKIKALVLTGRGRFFSAGGRN
jgi:enoyl-CoA hydratase/carnithine racemase